jgi:hypothetical protein
MTKADGGKQHNNQPSVKLVQVVWTCKRFHVGVAIGTLVVVLLLPLSLAMDDGEFNHGGGGGGGGGGNPVAAAAAAVAVVDNNWWQKWPAKRALTVARRCHRLWHYGRKHSSLKCCDSLNCQLLM